MTCAKTNSSRRYVIPHPIWTGWPAFTTAIVAFIDSFREALDMRRIAHKKRPFFDE
jgi:hypothetical protein